MRYTLLLLLFLLAACDTVNVEPVPDHNNPTPDPPSLKADHRIALTPNIPEPAPQGRLSTLEGTDDFSPEGKDVPR